MAVVLAPLIAQHGVAYMAPAVILAAVFTVTSESTKLSRAVCSLVSDNVMKGFLNGLGCLVIKSQLAFFIALKGSSALPSAILLASLSAFITFSRPSVFKGIPSSLVAVTATTVLAQTLALPATTLAQVFGASTFKGGLLALPSLTGVPFSVPMSMGTLSIVAPIAMSIALVSILNNAKDDKALYALSLGNIASSAFGGFGGCGRIPNILLRLQTVKGLTFTLAVVMCALFAAPLFGAIPLASLAGIILTVGFLTLQPTATIDSANGALRGGSIGMIDFVALISTGLICYWVNMAAGIGVGVGVTLLGNALVTNR